MPQITEVFEQTVQGLTRPIICRADDGNKYVVKGRHATVVGLINEVICAKLGKAFGLPVPDYELLEMPNAICRYDDNLRIRFGGIPCFGSRFVDNLQEFSRLSLRRVPGELLRDIFIFDYWIMNGDRNFTSENGGNPNLFVDPTGSNICVLDHNLAFDQAFDLKAFSELHVGREAWFVGRTGDLFAKAEYLPRMREALEACGTLEGLLPAEWLDEDLAARRHFEEVLLMQLMRFESDEFWQLL